MKEITPEELGLPKKFESWREGQREIIDHIASSPAPVFLLDAPPGILTMYAPIG